eukprot:TRINITY_DN3037_c0_g1_i2.p1 TRINITY_DN3037_c0_g1~~TRINITY_DN3037_c0_g1_i2.p1  ORF type:complete len:447 (+),score=166.78 TRINITY_DN3037_c0_g1_i2:471-1811(+)
MEALGDDGELDPTDPNLYELTENSAHHPNVKKISEILDAPSNIPLPTGQGSARDALNDEHLDAVYRSATDPVKRQAFSILQAANGAKFDNLADFNEFLEDNIAAEAAIQNLMFATGFKEYNKTPVRVAVTGAAGAIGYALLFRIASGAMFGPDQPVILQLLELPHAMKALNGVVMELNDCAFPLLHGIETSDAPEKGFEGADYVCLVGSKPRGPGMERADVLKDNAAIFSVQGKALDKTASKDVKVVVVGNPANTNALIASSNAPSINPRNFSALMRLDHNRAVGQLAERAGCAISDIDRVIVWGNHSATQYPDLSHATIRGEAAKKIINDDSWINNTYIPTVQKRGAAIIDARGASSAASAANATVDHMRDWILGSGGRWVSMAVPSDGSYGAEPGVYFGYPVVCANGEYTIVQNVPIDPASAKKIEISRQELFDERDGVANLLK